MKVLNVFFGFVIAIVSLLSIMTGYEFVSTCSDYFGITLGLVFMVVGFFALAYNYIIVNDK